MKNEFIKSLDWLKSDMCSTISNMNDQLVIVKHDLKVSMDNLNLSKVKFYQKWNTPSGPTTRIWKIWGGGTESFKNCPPPWLGYEENFEI